MPGWLASGQTRLADADPIMTAQPTENTRPGISLRKRSQFLLVQKTGQKAVGTGFIVQMAPLQGAKDDPNSWHYGLTASKKIGNAVVRNRAKRRLRALVRLAMPALARPQMAYVFIARQGLAAQGWTAMQEELAGLIKKLHRQKDSQSASRAAKNPAAPKNKGEFK